MAFTLSLAILKATERRITCPVTEAKSKEALRSKWEKMWVYGDKSAFENLLFQAWDISKHELEFLKAITIIEKIYMSTFYKDRHE